MGTEIFQFRPQGAKKNKNKIKIKNNCPILKKHGEVITSEYKRLQLFVFLLKSLHLFISILL